MKLEKEITIKVNSDYETLHNELIEKGFKIVENYQLNDIYMLPKSININSLKTLEILKKCCLIRNVVGIAKKIVYKYKKYDSENNIIEQGKVQCGIDSIDDAVKFMKSIDFVELFKIEDHTIVYSNNGICLAVQIVNDKYLFIEMEETSEHTSKKYDSIAEMKNDFNSIGLDCDYTNYFAKKAELVFNEKYKEK